MTKYLLIFLLFAFPASASHVMNAKWGCPTSEGAVAIAEAWLNDGDVVAVGQSHKCPLFPYPVEIEPVQFFGEAGRGYTWEVRFPNSEETFFSNYTIAAHNILLEMLAEQ